MTSTFAAMLILHVVAGLVGIGASYGTLMGLFKRQVSLMLLRWTSAIALVSYALSWFSAGYYYVLRYGTEVKPIILSGDYPAAHSFGMEVKEHLFLLLPILAAAALLVIWIHGTELSSNRLLWRGLVGVVALTVILGSIVALLGVVVSGSIR